MATPARLIINDATAARAGFPAPREDLYVVDGRGLVWRWREGEDNQLGELGFWEALIGLGTSVIGGIFGAKAASKQAEAMKEQARAQVEIEQLKLQQAQAIAAAGPQISPEMLMLAGGALLLILALK